MQKRIKQIDYDVRKVIGNTILKVRMTHKREFKFRLWLACQIMKLAGFVLGSKAEISCDFKNEN